MKEETIKCLKCEKEFEVDSEKYYWHLMIHKTQDVEMGRQYIYIPYQNPGNILPNCHYHNGSPCYNNPCVWI